MCGASLALIYLSLPALFGLGTPFVSFQDLVNECGEWLVVGKVGDATHSLNVVVSNGFEGLDVVNVDVLVGALRCKAVHLAGIFLVPFCDLSINKIAVSGERTAEDARGGLFFFKPRPLERTSRDLANFFLEEAIGSTDAALEAPSVVLTQSRAVANPTVDLCLATATGTARTRARPVAARAGVLVYVMKLANFAPVAVFAAVRVAVASTGALFTVSWDCLLDHACKRL